jgi:hypothetical protein
MVSTAGPFSDATDRAAGVVHGHIENSGGASLTNGLTTVGTLSLPVGRFLVTAKVDALLGRPQQRQ